MVRYPDGQRNIDPRDGRRVTEISELSGLPLIPPNPGEHANYFWSSAAKGKLMLSRCVEGGEFIWVPRPFCFSHSGSATTWIEASGKGSVYSYTIAYRGEGEFANRNPFVLAYVELDEGVRIMSNIIGDVDGLTIGSPVRVIFDISEAGFAIPRFTLDRAQEPDDNARRTGRLPTAPHVLIRYKEG